MFIYLSLPLTQFVMSCKRICWSRKWCCVADRRSDAPSALLVPRYLWLQRRTSTPVAPKETRTAADGLAALIPPTLRTFTAPHFHSNKSVRRLFRADFNILKRFIVLMIPSDCHMTTLSSSHSYLFTRMFSVLLQMYGVIVRWFGLEICLKNK